MSSPTAKACPVCHPGAAKRSCGQIVLSTKPSARSSARPIGPPARPKRSARRHHCSPDPASHWSTDAHRTRSRHRRRLAPKGKLLRSRRSRADRPSRFQHRPSGRQSASVLAAAKQTSDVMAGMKTDNRMAAMFGRGGAPNNARHVHKHFIAVDDCEAARCTERLAAREFPAARVPSRASLPLFPAGKLAVHRRSIVSSSLRL